MVNQSVWSGTLRCGLIHLPVRAVPAIRSEQVSFQQRHVGCGGRIQQGKLCANDGQLLDALEVARVYPLGDNDYVEITDDDMDGLKALSSPILTLDRFGPLEDLDALFLSHHYLLLPRQGGEPSYVLLAAALAAEGRAGMGQVVMRGREYTGVVAPYGRGLILTTLRPADEVVAGAVIDDALRDVDGPDPTELVLARQLVQTHSGTIDLTSVVDPYRERLMALIDERIAALEGSHRETATTAPIIDITELMPGAPAAAM